MTASALTNRLRALLSRMDDASLSEWERNNAREAAADMMDLPTMDAVAVRKAASEILRRVA